MRFRYTQEQLDFLRVGYRQMRVPELTRQFNSAFGLSKTASAIKCCLANHGFICGRPAGLRKGERLMLSPEQIDYLKKQYRRLTVVDATKALNERFGTDFAAQQIKTFVHNHGIDSGRTGQFEKGHVPANKGVKGWRAGGRSKETQFKKGRPIHEHRNYLPIGSTRITKDGYIERKVTDDKHLVPARRWVCEHRLVWQAAHGPIPDGHAVVFLDGNKRNVALENLRCVPRGVLQYLNKTGLNETSGEARKAAIATAEIVTRARQLERQCA